MKDHSLSPNVSTKWQTCKDEIIQILTFWKEKKKKAKQEKGVNTARIFKKMKMEDNCALELQPIGIAWVWLWNYKLQNETIQKNCSKYLPFPLEEAQGWVSVLSRRDDTSVRISVFTWLWEWDSELWNYNFRQLGGACVSTTVHVAI